MADRVLVSTVLEAITTHLREKRPTWTVEVSEGQRRIGVRASADESRYSSAGVRINDDARPFSHKPGEHVKSIDVSPRGYLRVTTYKALDDLPALCRKIEARLAEGFAEEARRDAERERERAEWDKANEEARAIEAAHPLAVAEDLEVQSDLSLVVRDRALVDVALAAIEAHLKARQGAK